MASGNVILFSKNKADLRQNDIVAGTFKLVLVTNAWTPDSTVTGNSVYADISANELATANGYTAGGLTLASVVATAITGGYKLSSASGVWTASGGSIPAWRYCVLMMSGTLWGKTSPLVGYFVGDSTPADIPATTTGNTLTAATPANGWFDLV
jgi:hypothetical protein